MEEVGSVLDHDILTIGFARRFTAYKRANLLLNDPERFEAIINSTLLIPRHILCSLSLRAKPIPKIMKERN